MEVSLFTEKLNKVDGNVYVIEEEVHLTDGVYEAPLAHDNINTATLAVFTGSKLTGDRLETYAISTPSLTPWKRVIRVYADVETVYISYETDGDTVEAEDINLVQGAVVETQEAVNAEEARALEAERVLTNGLWEEANRAGQEEARLDGQIDTETRRAQAAENVLSEDLAMEVTRAQTAEKTLTDKLSTEITRSKGVEKTLTDNLSAEVIRAETAEKANADNLSSEVTRAHAKEMELQGNIDTHTSTVAGEIQALRAADTALDEKKANTSDVNQELGNRYTKDQVFTKEEVLQKIEDLIGSAPDTLDTFKEIADALGNDPNFSTTIMNELSGKVDKVSGKQLTSNDYSDSEKAIVADVNAKKHTHSNKTVIDKITQGLLDNWSVAYTHVSDAVKHITAAERTNWTDAYNKRHEHGNKSVLDKITQAILDNWNDANSKKHTHSNKSILDTVTQAMLDKLAGIASGAQVNVQADWSVTDEASDAFIQNRPSVYPSSPHTHSKAQITDFPTSMPASDVAAWAKASAKPSYSWTEIGSKPSTFTPAAHTHTKSQISDMPTKLSQFTNDPGYLTAADVDTSQNHTHANKLVLDKISQTSLDTWNGKASTTVATQSANGLMAAADKKKLDGIAAGANNYVHPTASGSKHIPSGGSSGQFLKWSSDGTAVWAADNNTTYAVFKAATASAAGGTGLVPAPDAGAQAKYLRADGTWQTPPNTTYTHPSSGVTAGTYRSVTVNAQGHVTAGTNPTTLAGFGITDAAAKSHSHDSSYLKKGAVTWNDLKGV